MNLQDYSRMIQAATENGMSYIRRAEHTEKWIDQLAWYAMARQAFEYAASLLTPAHLSQAHTEAHDEPSPK